MPFNLIAITKINRPIKTKDSRVCSALMTSRIFKMSNQGPKSQIHTSYLYPLPLPQEIMNWYALVNLVRKRAAEWEIRS